MFSLLLVLLLPFVLGGSLKVDITNDTPGTQWSSGWSSATGSRYFGGTLMSAGDGGATLTYKFTGAAISVYGTSSGGRRTNSSYTLDGTTPRFHQDPTAVVTSNVLFYSSPALEDAQHTLLIQNLGSGDELQLDYFEVTGSTVQDRQLSSTPPWPRDENTKNEPLQPAVIAALAIASVAVLTGFILLFFLWRRQYIRERRESPGVPLQSQDDSQNAPFLNEHVRIEPFTSESPQPPRPLQPSQSSQTLRIKAPAVMTVTPLQPQPSREPVAAASSSRRDEKRLLPAVFTMESISRLNLGLEANPRDHSVVGQPSDYDSEANSVPPHHPDRENDGGVSLLGSSETINPKVLRLPPDYRRFYP